MVTSSGNCISMLVPIEKEFDVSIYLKDKVKGHSVLKIIPFLCNAEWLQKTKQNKTKQNKTKQNKTKQNKTKQNKTKTKQNKTKQNKTKQNKTKTKTKQKTSHRKTKFN